MEEWTIERWNQVMQGEQAFLYLYTPLCGTCEVASKMLNIVKILNPSLQVGKMNVNYNQSIAIQYEVESVPCLLIAENGVIQKKIYAFQSVPYLNDLVKK
ncbi:MAG: thioredoxin family protein [Lysinibacillus sp.]